MRERSTYPRRTGRFVGKAVAATAMGVIALLALMGAGAQATGAGGIAAGCSNETVTVFGKTTTVRFVLHGVSCSEAHRTIRAYFGEATPQRCRQAGNICGLEVPGGWSCALAGAASEAPLIAGCFRGGASVKVYPATPPSKAPPPPTPGGVYINCQNQIAANGFPTQALIPLQHPSRCVVFGQPESLATLYPLVHARWTAWGTARTTVNATWVNPSPREGGPIPIRATAFRIRRGCDGRRFYTRIGFPGMPHAIVLHLSAACTLPPL
jgi:hypothetical protein